MRKKNVIFWLFVTVVIMVSLPWLAVTFVKSDGGMAVSLVLLFGVNPVYSVCTGILAGRDPKTLWRLPILSSVFFLLGAWLFLDMGEKSFVCYGIIYLLVGFTAMAANARWRRME